MYTHAYIEKTTLLQTTIGRLLQRRTPQNQRLTNNNELTFSFASARIKLFSRQKQIVNDKRETQRVMVVIAITG